MVTLRISWGTRMVVGLRGVLPLCKPVLMPIVNQQLVALCTDIRFRRAPEKEYTYGYIQCKEGLVASSLFRYRKACSPLPRFPIVR